MEGTLSGTNTNSPTPPPSPAESDLWFNTTNGREYVWYISPGTGLGSWVQTQPTSAVIPSVTPPPTPPAPPAPGPFDVTRVPTQTVSEVPPTSPAPLSGDLWWNTRTGQEFIYYNDGSTQQWVLANRGNGLTGDNGDDAFTRTTAPFVMPAVGANVIALVIDQSFYSVGQSVYVEGAGYFTVFGVLADQVGLTNTGAPGNAPPTTVIASGVALLIAGPVGVGSPPYGPAGGVLSGTYPNPGFAPDPVFTPDVTIKTPVPSVGSSDGLHIVDPDGASWIDFYAWTGGAGYGQTEIDGYSYIAPGSFGLGINGWTARGTPSAMAQVDDGDGLMYLAANGWNDDAGGYWASGPFIEFDVEGTPGTAAGAMPARAYLSMLGSAAWGAIGENYAWDFHADGNSYFGIGGAIHVTPDGKTRIASSATIEVGVPPDGDASQGLHISNPGVAPDGTSGLHIYKWAKAGFVDEAYELDAYAYGVPGGIGFGIWSAYARGTPDAPLPAGDGDEVFYINGAGFNGSGWPAGAALGFDVMGTPGVDGVMPIRAYFQLWNGTANGGGPWYPFDAHPDGNTYLGIGGAIHVTPDGKVHVPVPLAGTDDDTAAPTSFVHDAIAAIVIPPIPPSLPPSGPAGGALSGTYPNPGLAAPYPTTLPPNGPAGGDLAGTYPNPTIGAGKVTPAKIAPSATNGQVLTTVAGAVAWAAAAGGTTISIGVAPPASPAAGALWWFSDGSAGGGQLYIFYDDGNSQQWVPAAAAAGPITPPLISKSYVSPPQAIVAAGGITLAHGLGTTPLFTTVKLRCLIAEGGYTVGQEPVFYSGEGNTGGTSGRGVMAWSDAVNINARVASATTPLEIIHAVNGTIFNLTLANWALVFSAFA